VDPAIYPPVLIAPDDEAEVPLDEDVVLRIANSTDSDGTTRTYSFEISSGGSVVWEDIDVPEGTTTSGTTTTTRAPTTSGMTTSWSPTTTTRAAATAAAHWWRQVRRLEPGCS